MRALRTSGSTSASIQRDTEELRRGGAAGAHFLLSLTEATIHLADETVKYDSPKNKDLVEEEILGELLRIRRKVRVDKGDDFEIPGTDSSPNSGGN